MSMSTQPPEKQSGGMTAPALRFRTSMTLWGPLQLTLTNHLAGAELGYEAGRTAYQEGSNETLERAMQRFLAAPRYRPRACTLRVIAEWQAMFLLGWTSGLLEEPTQESPREAITDEQCKQDEASRPTAPIIATHGSKRWREGR